MTGFRDFDTVRNPHRVNPHAGPDGPDRVTDRDRREHAAFRDAWIQAGQQRVWDPERGCWWTVPRNSEPGAKR